MKFYKTETIVFLIIFVAQNINATVKIAVKGDKMLYNGKLTYHYHALVVVGDKAYTYGKNTNGESILEVMDGLFLQKQYERKIFLKSLLQKLTDAKSLKSEFIKSLQLELKELENINIFLAPVDVKEPANPEELAQNVVKSMGEYDPLFNNCMDFTFEFVRRMNGGELLAKWPNCMIELHSQRVALGGFSKLFGGDIPIDGHYIYNYKQSKTMNTKDNPKMEQAVYEYIMDKVENQSNVSVDELMEINHFAMEKIMKKKEISEKEKQAIDEYIMEQKKAIFETMEKK